ncbi:MAG: NADH:ubiquinone reductase (Na(+)-transporting) subunit A [SAR86 cluster bacterium]|uniref:Na(+)-translocating NADH-quinone reductase subunit A n=1 Tax=SAR86 cluster bacterium TaxID=2030880 RepID=A0A2A5BB31_9GAMM|nr:MAG: NADH:ubiquinone reductase (Na(+)-transporting) subunit A [SAR86 cluster bacterium]
MIRIKRGLNLPISGEPEQLAGKAQATRSVALLGCDYIGLKPTMLVAQGDRVKLGQPLFRDKKNPSVIFTSPACGVVATINRGTQRKLLSVVIELDGDDQVPLHSYSDSQLNSLSRQCIVDDLLLSGLWTSLRTRPYSKVPDPEVVPHTLFINAMDTNPLAANPVVVMKAQVEDFVLGANLLSSLADGKTYVCVDRKVDALLKQKEFTDKIVVQEFRGPHPSGLTGTHIHCIEPAGVGKQVWSINYQDVIAIGKLFASGQLCMDRIISLAGPQVTEPRLITTRIGANLDEISVGELEPHESRLISGSVLGGRTAAGVECYLGRYHLQVSVLREGRERPLFGYLSPGANRHSVMGIYISGIYKDKRHAMSTSTQGSSRAMVPIGAYEKVMPLDILPTQLLRALIVGDIESAQNLGALELDEEDLALCSYVCPGKYEYGPILRDNLTLIEKEG